MAYKTAEEAIAAKKPKDGEFIGFSGNNCDDPCAGWDGESRRCECGNRRVSWVTEQDADGKYSAHAEAY